MIVPNARFNCNGRITNVAASMKGWSGATNNPLFEVWRPYIYSGSYMKIGEVHFSAGSLKGVGQGSYYYANISLNSSSQIEFQSGVVIGYYQPSNACLKWNIQTSGYTSYSNTVTSPLTSIDINNVDNIETDRQPLIELTFGKIIDQVFKIYR